MSIKLKKALFAVIAAVFGLLLYGNTIRYGFTWDDTMVLRSAADARHASSALSFMTSSTDRLYRPLRTLAYSIESRAFGASPAGYHAVNAALYALACAMFFLLASALKLIDLNAALAAALLFAAHHTHAETVASVGNGLADLLCAVFLFPCLLLIPRASKSASVLALAVFLFAFALLSKESAAASAAAVFLLFLFNEDGFSQKLARPVVKAALKTSPFLMVTILFFIGRKAVLGGAMQAADWHGGSFSATALTSLSIVNDYAAMLFAPVRQCAVYTVDVSRHITPDAAIGAAILASLAAAGIATIRKAPAISFAALFALAAWLPVSNLVPLAMLKSSRFMFLPSVGACIAAAAALSYVARMFIKDKSKASFAGLAAALALSLWYATGAAAASSVWMSDETLWTKTTSCAAGSALVHNNLGKVFAGKGDLAGAEKAFKEAMRINPSFPQPYTNLANIYGGRGQYAKALPLLSKVRMLPGHEPATDCRMGFSLLKLGLKEEAAILYESCRKEMTGAKR